MMAGYRPKSLDELNNIFDKTIAAEKAIKKGSFLLEKGEDAFSSFSVNSEAVSENEKNSVTEKQSEEITDSVSDFIAKFTAETETEQIKSKPQMTFVSVEAPKKEFEIEAEASHEEAGSPVREAERPDRDELFKDYAKIMSDDEEDIPSSKKLSRKEKKKLRKQEKTVRKEEINPVDTTEEEVNSAEQVEEQVEEAKAEEIIAESDAQATATEDSFADETENAADEAYSENNEDENDDFAFPEDYTPAWVENEAEEEDEEEEEKKDKNIGLSILKAFLALVLIALVSVSALATLLKTVVSVNTGKVVADKYYVFTTYKDYPELGIENGALVVTEKKFAEDGESFVYVDYSNKSFEFAKRSDSITKEDGEVLYVAEKDGGRVLVSRDDCKGVVSRIYSGNGNIVRLLTDNYIVIVAASAVLSLVIVLVFVLVLRGKKHGMSELEDVIMEDSFEFSEDEEFENIFSTIE